MVSWSKVKAVYTKDLRDCLRDRRTLFATFVVPIMIWPIVVLLILEASKTAQSNRDKETYVIAVEPPQMVPFLTELAKNEAAEDHKNVEKEFKKEAEAGKSTAYLTNPETYKSSFERLVFRGDIHEEAALKALRNRELQIILQVPDFLDKMDRLTVKGVQDAGELYSVPKITINFDKAENKSLNALDSVRGLLKRHEIHVKQARLKRANVPKEYLEPFKIEKEESVAPPEKVGGSITGTIIPVVFIFMLITGSLAPAINLTAGEKERSTLETLISAPVTTLDIVVGKFLVVATMGLVTASLNVSSFGITCVSVGADKLPDVSFPWVMLPSALLLLLPLALLFAALLMASASLGASYMEAQVYCTPIYLFPLLGLGISMIPGIELDGALMVAPVLNTALLIRELLIGHPGLLGKYLFVLATTFVYAAAAVALAARIFAREEILFNAQGSLRLLLSRRAFRPTLAPRASDALLIVALLFPCFFYFSTGLQRALMPDLSGISKESLLISILAPQGLVILFLPLLACWYMRCNPQYTFSWRPPTLKGLLAAICLGSTSWILVNQLVVWMLYLFPMEQDASMKFMHDLLINLDPWVRVVLFGMVPAFCEEHLFRGFLLSSFMTERRKWFGIVATAAIFALFHLSVFKMLPIFLLGIALAYLAWQSGSLWPGVLFHCMHNGISVASEGNETVKHWFGESNTSTSLLMPLHILLPAIAIFGLGLWFAKTSGPSRREEAEARARPAVSPVLNGTAAAK